MPSPVLLWIRQDLRLSGQAALVAAIDRGGAVLPVFVWAPEEEEPWSPGAATADPDVGSWNGPYGELGFSGENSPTFRLLFP